MKLKETLLLLSTALICTLLFYKQSWGLNVPVFALLIVTAQAVYKPELRHNRSWLWASFVTMVAALAYYFTNNSGAACLFVLSVVFSSGLQMKDSLLLFLPFHAFLNFFLAPIALIVERVSHTFTSEKKSISIRLFLFPVLIFTVFLIVYAVANPLLWEQLSALFAIIDATFALCFILSFLIILPIIRGQIIGWLSSLENLCEKIIGFVSEPRKSSDQEKVTRLMKEALLVFGSLIVLLTYMILLDGYELIYNSTQASLSANLHASIYILIASMFMAIGVILYYFSLPVIFHPKFDRIKWAVNSWIALNILLCIICLIKNNVYVHELGLTYKRIGVYTYLLTTIFALLITAYKTNASLNNWMLIKANTWMIYGVLMIFVCVPWDIVITRYNLNYTKDPDIAYIYSLSKQAQLEYLSITLEKDNSPEQKKLLLEQLKNLDYYTIQYLQSEKALSLTAEDHRMLHQYAELDEKYDLKNLY
ncbi:MAG: hypothetical protein JWM14_145 [Chitinophagaceae bacterium]|nr:hypothetical protein [Chitinophagaceae bacterium]